MTATARTDVAEVLERSGLPFELTAFVDGQFLPAPAGAGLLDVDDPATGVVVARVAETSADQVAEAVRSAHEAYLRWWQLDPP